MCEAIPGWAVTAAVACLDVVAIGFAVIRGHRVEGTLAWIFAILLIPVGGAVVYFALSSPGIRRTTQRKRASRFALSRGSVDYGDHPEGEGLLRLCAKATSLPPTSGNQVISLTEQEHGAFPRIEQALGEARSSIWAEYYIIRRDVTGARFLDLLIQRARAGVEVRLIYDAFGSMEIDTDLLGQLREAGGKAVAFLPLNPLRRRWALHLRNHRKLIVVDGSIAFTGGMNVGNEYSGRRRKAGVVPFRDSHLEIHGPAVLDLAHVFTEDWAFATYETLADPPEPEAACCPGSNVAIIPSGPDQIRNATSDVYFAAIAGAHSRIWLTTPYFVPDAPILQGLTTAAMRGVNVRVMVPAHPDVKAVRSSARFYYGELLAAGVHIHEYQPAMLHAKTMVVDGLISLVGSANVDFRSLRLNFEVSSLVVERAFADQMEQRFKEDLAHCAEITLRDVEARTFLQRLRYGTARLLSPLL